METRLETWIILLWLTPRDFTRQRESSHLERVNADVPGKVNGYVQGHIGRITSTFPTRKISTIIFSSVEPSLGKPIFKGPVHTSKLDRSQIELKKGLRVNTRTRTVINAIEYISSVNIFTKRTEIDLRSVSDWSPCERTERHQSQSVCVIVGPLKRRLGRFSLFFREFYPPMKPT